MSRTSRFLDNWCPECQQDVDLCTCTELPTSNDDEVLMEPHSVPEAWDKTHQKDEEAEWEQLIIDQAELYDDIADPEARFAF